jgi:hypothetical protein
MMIQSMFSRIFRFKNRSKEVPLRDTSACISAISYNSNKLPSSSAHDNYTDDDGDDDNDSLSSLNPYSNTNNIYLPPSCIRYINTNDDAIIRIDDNDINIISKQIVESNCVPPKLQIVQYNSLYYSINNSALQIYKKLERIGIITHVEADLVSIDRIPSSLKKHLLDFDPLNDNDENDNFEVQNSHQQLVDETYEFGESEKCIDDEELTEK